MLRTTLEKADRYQALHAGPAFVAARFGLERMIDETLALYDPEAADPPRAKQLYTAPVPD